MSLSYAVQPSPNGLAQAFVIGRDFVGGAPSALVLGDNIFYGHDLPTQLANANGAASGATVFAYHVQDPQRYGVVEFDANRRACSASRRSRPRRKSNYAVTGLYFYDDQVLRHRGRHSRRRRAASSRSPTSTARYLSMGQLDVEIMGRGYRVARHRHARLAARGVGTSSRRSSGGRA